MAKRRTKALWAELAADLADLQRSRPVFTGERVNADIYQELLRQNVVLGQRTYCDGKYVFWQIQRRPTPQKPPSGWRNSSFWRIHCHICWTWTRLNSLPGAFCRQKPKLPLNQILAPYVRQSLWNGTASGGIHPQDLSLFPPLALSRR
jgi:hypothetical protein